MMEIDYVGGDAPLDGIYQDIKTAPGKEYILKFDMRARGHEFDSDGECIEVEWNGVQTYRGCYTAPTANVWKTHVVRVHGERGADLDRLTLRESSAEGASTGYGPVLDNVSLKPSSDLIRNGSFEANPVAALQYVALPAASVPGWGSLNGQPIELWASNHRGFPASDGHVMMEMDFNGSTNLDVVYQDVFTEKGRPYLLEFDMRARGHNPDSEDETLFVKWNGALTDRRLTEVQSSGYRASAKNTWTTHVVRVIGTGGLDRLSFHESSSAHANDGSGPLLDRVCLRPEELLFNGSFEENTVSDRGYTALPDSKVPGWNSLNGQKIELWDSYHRGFPASDGHTMMEMDYIGGSAALDGIYQDIETEAGRSYTVQFDMRARGHNPASDEEVIVVEWNGAASEYRASAVDTWTTHTVIVVGCGGMDRLLFRESNASGASTGSGPLLDNISFHVTYGNLVRNGSFEENHVAAKAYKAFPGEQVPGWTSLKGQKIELWASNHRGFPASDGDVMMEMDYVGGHAALDGIYQDIDLVAGNPYMLSFDMRARKADPTVDDEVIVLEWNGVATEYRASAANTWTTHTTTVVGGEGIDRLLFRESDVAGASTGYGPLLDNISLKIAFGNLVRNGSFEENQVKAKSKAFLPGIQVPGWASLNGQKIELWSSNVKGIPTSDGDIMMEMDYNGGSAALDGIYQDINLVAGKPYELSFDMRARDGDPASEGEKIVVEWNGVPTKALGYSASAANTWTTHTTTVVGSAGMDRLLFRESDVAGASTGSGPMLDNIQLIDLEEITF